MTLPRRAPALAALLLLVPACDVSGLVDLGNTLLDPQAALLDTPGRKLIAGNFRNLVVDGSIETGGTVLAFRVDADQPTVAVVPFKDGSPCEISPAVAFDRLSSRLDVSLPGLIAIQEDEFEGVGSLSFYGFDCQRRLSTLANASLPRTLFPAIQPWGVLALSGAGELYVVDAEQVTLSKIANDAAAPFATPDRLWSLEGEEGQRKLVVRDDSLRVIARLGENVAYYIATGGTVLPVVFAETPPPETAPPEDEPTEAPPEDEPVDPAASAPQGQALYYFQDDGAVQFSSDGCNMSYLGDDAIMYHDPCKDRRLRILTSSRKVTRPPRSQEQMLVTLTGPSQIRLPDLQVNWGLGVQATEFLLMQTPDANVAEGDLLVSSLSVERAQEGDVELTTKRLGAAITAVGGRFYENYEQGRGTLLDIERNEALSATGLKPLAKNVVQLPGFDPYSIRGVLADFDGSAGRLIRLVESEDGSVTQELVARNVPFQDHQVDDNAELIAFVADLDNEGSGTLVLADDKKTYVIAKGVLINTVRFLDDPFGLIYLAKNDQAGSGSLRVHLIDPGIDLPVHDSVSEYRAIPWPSPGVLYAVADGEDQGLWFAKAR